MDGRFKAATDSKMFRVDLGGVGDRTLLEWLYVNNEYRKRMKERKNRRRDKQKEKDKEKKERKNEWMQERAKKEERQAEKRERIKIDKHKSRRI